MGDKIDFNAALEDCNRVRDGIKSDEDFQNADSGLVMYYLNTIVQALEIAATVKRGKWIDSGVNGTVHCSNCQFTDFFAKRDRVMLFDFCPSCGADMRGAT